MLPTPPISPIVVNPRRNTVINQSHLPYGGTSQPSIMGSSYPYGLGKLTKTTKICSQQAHGVEMM